MELLDILASGKLTWDKSAKVSELPLSNMLGSAIMAGFNLTEHKQWLVPSLEAYDNACHTYMIWKYFWKILLIF